MRLKLNPAQFAIHRFGGVHALAKAIGLTPPTVCKWQQPRKWEGSTGSIPAGAQRKVLKAAREHGLDITAEHLILGGVIVTDGV